MLALLLMALLTAYGAVCAWRVRNMMYTALDGRRTRTAQTAHIPEFTLRAQMNSAQAFSQVNGFMAIAEQKAIELSVDGEMRYARVFEPIGDQKENVWALVLHGGVGTDGSSLLDVACRLSLHGYRVVLPDLRGHGESEGTLCTMGIAESEDVLAWINWIDMQDRNARTVVYGMDEGGVAALLAAQRRPGCILAIAADSVYTDCFARAQQIEQETYPDCTKMEKILFHLAYKAMCLQGSKHGDVLRAVAEIDADLLLIHGTGDEDVPAWHSEDAAAAGRRAQLLLVEGAAHGFARFIDPDAYYEALLSFYTRALEQ